MVRGDALEWYRSYSTHREEWETKPPQGAVKIKRRHPLARPSGLGATPDALDGIAQRQGLSLLSRKAQMRPPYPSSPLLREISNTDISEV